jgi:predicted nucleic acid-binding protein
MLTGETNPAGRKVPPPAALGHSGHRTTARDMEEEYAAFPLGGTDASVIALAERLQAPLVVTLDRRHFTAVRPRHRDAFELLP